jgi:hypothetical protein
MDLLCSLADVKAYLDIPDATTNADAKLTDLIEVVSAYAVNQANLPDREDGDDPSFFESDYTEHYDGPGGTVLLLRHSAPSTPVTAVRAVTVDGSSIPKSGGAPAPGFSSDRFSVRLRGYRFTKGEQNVVVKYSAGVDQASSTGVALKGAATEWVASIYKTRPHIDIQSKTLDRETITFVQKTMPVRMSAVLENLKTRMAAA